MPRSGLLVVLLMGILALFCGCGEPDSGAAVANLGGSRLGLVLGKDDGSNRFAQADRPRAFVFPGEHQQHADFRSEWWYLTMTLASEDGTEYGAQFTVFRQAIKPVNPATTRPSDWDLDQVYLGHLAITDVAARTHDHEERLSRQHPVLATVQPLAGGGAGVVLEGWQLDLQTEGARLLAEGPYLGLDLNLKATRDPVLQGQQGWSRKSASQASYYYSWPRLQVVGQIRVGGHLQQVHGLGWFDHEWSTSVLSDEQVGWEWFALGLDDGRDLMAFRLRRRDGHRDVHDHGVLMGADGTTRVLGPADFQLYPERTWTDPAGVAWPLGWKLTVASEIFLIDTPVDDQRMQTLIPYWEGLVEVTSDTGRRLGRGYMELTGYEAAPSGS